MEENNIVAVMRWNMAGSLRNAPLQQSYCTNAADNGRLESQRLGTHVRAGERKKFLTTFVLWKINYRQMCSRCVDLARRESSYATLCAKPMQTAA